MSLPPFGEIVDPVAVLVVPAIQTGFLVLLHASTFCLELRFTKMIEADIVESTAGTSI
jgi:hypothetical protein